MGGLVYHGGWGLGGMRSGGLGSGVSCGLESGNGEVEGLGVM